jgi:hypothetical protein
LLIKKEKLNMKNLFAALAAIFAMTFATAASAENFKNNTFSVTAISGSLDFTLDGDKDGLTDAEVGAVFLPHSLGSFDADVRVAFAYDLDSSRVGVRGEYGVAGEVATNLAVYSIAAVEYVTSASDLGNGDFLLDPSFSVAYHITDRVSVFGEVGYTWDLSNSFDRLGGYAEVGVPFAVTDSITVTPSVVREFDTGNRDYNFNLGVAFAF